LDGIHFPPCGAQSVGTSYSITFAIAVTHPQQL
jgi:hypothetical protein